jgi:hypothetical protein
MVTASNIALTVHVLKTQFHNISMIEFFMHDIVVQSHGMQANPSCLIHYQPQNTGICEGTTMNLVDVSYPCGMLTKSITCRY